LNLFADESSEPILPDPRHRQSTTLSPASSNQARNALADDPTGVTIERLLDIQQCYCQGHRQRQCLLDQRLPRFKARSAAT
jgi:hypothetical protein